MLVRYKCKEPFVVVTKSGKKVAECSNRYKAYSIAAEGRSRIVLQSTVSFNAQGRVYTSEV